MDLIKKIFPFSFGAADVKALVIKIVLYVVAAVVAALVLWLAGMIVGWIPVVGKVIGVVLRLVGWGVEIYVTGGIVFSILAYTKVIR